MMSGLEWFPGSCHLLGAKRLLLFMTYDSCSYDVFFLRYLEYELK